MKTVQPQTKIVSGILGDQEVSWETEYRPIRFLVLNKIDSDFVVYNALTCEMVVVSAEEYAILNSESVYASEVSEELIKKWYLVPKEHDDVKLVDEIRAFIKVLPSSEDACGYVVFPTSDCNARCFYCFELGCSKKSMDEKTAHETAEFILRTCNMEKTIDLRWFGGEPTYNQSAIDIICNDLCKAGVKYTSKMVTNGYLFDQKTVEKAVNLWHLKKVQITLDGTEEVYNQTKAYIYQDDKSPFITVTDNIERLLRANITVNVRMNMLSYNEEDLYKLVDFVYERYKGFPNIWVYPARLFPTKEEYSKEGEMERRIEELDRYFLLEKHCKDRGLMPAEKLKTTLIKSGCMAQNDSAYVILPDGHLALCEHFIDSEFVGSIKDGITDHQKANEYKKIVYSKELCHDCKVYPFCMVSQKCPNHFYGCDIVYRKFVEHIADDSLEFTYRELVKKES